MRRILCVFGVLGILFSLNAFVLAQSETTSAGAAGDWDVALNTPGGVRNLKATFKVEGEKLTGAIKSERGEIPLEGTYKGKEVKFSYTIKYMDNDLTISMSGNLDGDTIKGAVDFGGFAQDEWSAKRASASAGAATATAASAAEPKSADKIDLTGAWNFTVETQAGSGNPTFTFKQEGEKLTGKYKGAFGEADLTGTVKGDQVEFSFKVSGQIEGTVTYTGTTDGKEIKGKAKLAELGEGTFTGKKQ
ncbi:MAG: hypothetical protein J2P41_18065 [Blastocatellia bacterium]|nr:hypothetical protein [Blastocatellia bacterium]